MRLPQRLLVWLGVILVLFSLAGLQDMTDRSSSSFKLAQKKAALQLSEPLIPGPTPLRFLSLGDPQVVADLLWLQTIQYFGSGNPYGNFPSLGPLLRTITDLDPRFEYPYEFALIVLPFMNATPMAVQLGEKAVQQYPQNGLLKYYLASTYLLNVKDYRKAATYYEQAAKLPDSPAAAAQLAGISLSRLRDSVNDRLVAMAYWQTVYQNAKTEDEKTRARNWFTQMQILYNLETAAQQFKQREGRFPSTLQELIDRGYIQSIPASTVERVYGYHPESGTITLDPVTHSGE